MNRINRYVYLCVAIMWIPNLNIIHSNFYDETTSIYCFHSMITFYDSSSSTFYEVNVLILQDAIIYWKHLQCFIGYLLRTSNN